MVVSLLQDREHEVVYQTGAGGCYEGEGCVGRGSQSLAAKPRQLTELNQLLVVQLVFILSMIAHYGLDIELI